MTGHEMPVPQVPSLRTILTMRLGTSMQVEALLAELLDREDQIADLLRLAGQQFGAEPAFVAEVLAVAGLGTPLSADERLVVHEQFHATMERLRREYGTSE